METATRDSTCPTTAHPPGADPGGVPGVPRNPLNFVNVLLETIGMSMYMSMSMYMYQLFSFDYTGTPL